MPRGTKVRWTGATGRFVLPKGWENIEVIWEQVSESEIRIRKANVTPVEKPTLEQITRMAEQGLPPDPFTHEAEARLKELEEQWRREGILDADYSNPER